MTSLDLELRRKMAQSKAPTNYLGYLLSKNPSTGKSTRDHEETKTIIFFRRLQWVAHLEFSHNTEVSDLTWDTVEERLPRTDRLRVMVRQGIPHSLRPQLWMRMSGASKSIDSQHLFFNVFIFYQVPSRRNCPRRPVTRMW
jgi:hypothetical protein